METQAIYPHADIRKESFGGIVFNSSGNLVYLEKQDAACYEELVRSTGENESSTKFSQNISSEALLRLYTAGYISQNNDHGGYRVIENEGSLKEGRLSAPMSAHLYPTYACNEMCFFCYNRKQRNQHTVSDEYYAHICKLIDDLYSMGVPSINFFRRRAAALF